MTAFVRLSNKKHLQHASRHAELHFSDGLCIMAHSPKAFLLTFHLLVRKSHYQHKMNFLKLEAYPLLARIRQLLPVLGQCLMYFIAAVFLLVASNAALTGSLHGLLGKASHTALGAVPLAAFLCLYRKLFKNPCSQAELNKIVPFGFSLQRQKMVFFCHQNSIILLC